ncbi:MAG TPA: hypothetical protein VM345_07585 [Acidimicrobiales bacterium]|nr:hypothetical protein [Acidimicrobiales bacterium]
MRAHRRVGVAVVVAAVCAAIASAGSIGAPVGAKSLTGPALVDPGPEGVLSGEFDAFAVRVEYDLPLPFGAGTVPHVVGEVRRSGAGENAKGLAAAPTHFDAVVGGTYYDPDKSQKGDENLPPQVECFYPGSSVDTRFDFPTDTRGETAGLPATSFAIARCDAGPIVSLRVAAGAAELPSVLVAGGAADGEARPVERRLLSKAAARASDITLAGGAIKVGSVEASGESTVTGAPGGARTMSRITVNDVDVAGVRFSIANDRLVIAGREVPIDGGAAKAVVGAANTALKAAAPGCRIDVTTEPETFPQGFLLSRKPPQIGVAEDGTAASSMRAGMQVLCDIPSSLSEPSGFSPQRFQAVLGFVYTGAYASTEPSGFSLANLADLTDGFDSESFSGDGALGSSLDTPTSIGGQATGIGVVEPAATPAAEAPTAAGAPRGTKLVTRYRTVPVAAVRMSTVARVSLGVAALLAWMALTHLGLRRLRGVTRP